VVGEASRHIQEPLVTRTAQLPDRRLEQVAGTIKLMGRRQVREGCVRCPQLEPGMKITVGSLSGFDKRYHPVGERAELVRVTVLRGSAQLPANCLQPLVNVGVDEVLALVSAGVTSCGHELEVAKAAGALQALVPGGQARASISSLAALQKPSVIRSSLPLRGDSLQR